MEKHPVSELMETVMSKIREMVDVSTVIGEPINTPDGTTIIPVSKLSFGFASGGADFSAKSQETGGKKPFGGGSGAGVKVTPVSFVIVKDGNVRIMNVEAPASTSIERIVDAAPDLIDKIGAAIKKEKKPEV